MHIESIIPINIHINIIIIISVKQHQIDFIMVEVYDWSLFLFNNK